MLNNVFTVRSFIVYTVHLLVLECDMRDGGWSTQTLSGVEDLRRVLVVREEYDPSAVMR